MLSKTLNYYSANAPLLTERYELADVQEIQNLLLKTFTKKSKLLEIGCGSGRDAFFMFSNGYNITAVDGSEIMISESKKIHPELSNNLFHKILPNDLNFDIKFDGVYTIATLMHLDKNDIEKTILSIYDLLNQSGKFLMSVSLSRDDINENGFDEKGRFFLILEQKEWLNMCKDVGFKILKTKINKDGLNRDGITWLILILEK